MNLDVESPDKVASAAIAYRESAVELPTAWQDRNIPMIWTAIASQLDLRRRHPLIVSSTTPTASIDLTGDRRCRRRTIPVVRAIK
jgi:hypothetical protein